MTQASFPELTELQQTVADAGLEMHVACEVTCGQRRFPVPVVTLGCADRSAPAVGFFGGVHGLERIGAEVVIAYLRSLTMRLRWDGSLHHLLESVRLIFMPIINPGGFWRGTRANPNGVDLMRNAPLDATEAAPFLLGGQRISANLPWYRGREDAPMEMENQAVCRVVTEELLNREFSMAIDCHSGFGLKDRIWFPYAHTLRPIEHLAEMHALKEILDQTHSQHPYVFEPQSRQYLAHGDLWDYLYLLAIREPTRVFLPLTLEMGSWSWVKKNPRQVFSRHGIFNPSIHHRQQRVLRRHGILLDFLTRATCSYRNWLPRAAHRTLHHERALNAWYGA